VDLYFYTVCPSGDASPFVAEYMPDCVFMLGMPVLEILKLSWCD
jgi:hypothetical protein